MRNPRNTSARSARVQCTDRRSGAIYEQREWWRKSSQIRHFWPRVRWRPNASFPRTMLNGSWSSRRKVRSPTSAASADWARLKRNSTIPMMSTVFGTNNISSRRNKGMEARSWSGDVPFILAWATLLGRRYYECRILREDSSQLCYRVAIRCCRKGATFFI